MAGLSPDALFELETRIETVRGSVRRSRLAFLALTLASLGLLLLVWNCYFSWNSFIAQPRDPSLPALSETTKLLRDELLRSWVRSWWSPTSTLGVNIGVADASFLGSLILLVLTVWFYFSARRENHTTARLLHDGLTVHIPEIRRAVFWAVADEHIFLNWAKIDRPAFSILFDRDTDSTSEMFEQPDHVVRSALWLMGLLPFFTLAMSWGMDLYSLTQPSVMRDGSQALWSVLSLSERRRAIAILVGAGALALVLLYLLRRIKAFNSDTVEALRYFAKQVKEIPDPPSPSPRSGPRRSVPTGVIPRTAPLDPVT